MKGLDTNVLVRLYTNDTPAQAQRAQDLLDEEGRDELLVNTLVLLEAEWVLRDQYDATKAQVIDFFEQVLALRDIKVLDEPAVRNALHGYQNGRADFADYLISSVNHSAGAESTYTFDRTAGREPGFRIVP